MGLSFRRLLLFEGLFEVASLGRVARSPDFCLPLFQCRGEGERKTPPPPASHYLFNLLCPPPPSFSLKAPPGTAKIPPAHGKAEGRTAAFVLFQSARGLQASRCRLSAGPPQLPGKPGSQRVEGHGGPGSIRDGGLVRDFRNKLCSPLEELIHKYSQRALSCHSLRFRCQKQRK